MFVRDWYRWISLYSILFIFIVVMTIVSSGGDLANYFEDQTEQIFFIAFIFVWAGLIIFISIFFRDPERIPASGIVAPADGVVKDVMEESIAGKSHTRIVTFMNVHNVHVNRVPMDGVVERITRHKGKFLPAYKDESIHNLQVETVLKTRIGKIKIYQITGVFARRIEVYIAAGKEVRKGERLGLIKFGSRVDLVLPTNKVKININVGDKVKANETSMAEIVK